MINPTTSVQEEFFSWLSKKVSSAQLSEYGIACIDIAEFCLQEKILDKKLFETTDLKIIENLIDIMKPSKIGKKFRVAYGHNLSKIETVLRYYCSFLKTTNPKPPLPADEKSGKLEKYSKILSKFFGENGYQIGKVIYRNRCKQYFFDEYGEKLKESGEQIDAILTKIGTQRDNRIFPKQNENQNQLIDDIVNDIVSVFESGVSAVFIEAVYDKYKQPLADNLKIYDEKTLVPLILQNSVEKFSQYNALYFYPRNKKDDPVDDVLKFMREKHQPLSFNQISAELWYIPKNKLESIIKNQIRSIVYVANEMLFYAPNLPIDEMELQKISSLLQSEIDFHGYITDVKMMELIKSKYPLIAMSLEGFNAYSVRKCLRYIFDGRFSFNGPVISELGSQLNLGEVYADFVRDHENLMLEELKNFAKELETGIYWKNVLNEMVRVSQNNFVRKNLINFDVELIDNILGEMYPQDYTPLKEVTLFINFPNVGYAWNIYLLESYLYNFSQKFRLVHSSFSESGVYGAMVRVDSPITDYESLITDALSYSDPLTESKALQFIVEQGFQQRRTLKNIDNVIKNATIRKLNRKRN